MNRYEYERIDKNTKNILEELAEEYKLLLIKRVMEEQLKSIEEVNYRDVILMDEEIKQNLYKTKEKKKERLLKLTILTGLLYAVFGFGFYFIQNTIFTISDFREQVGLLIGVVGLSLSVMAYFFQTFKKDVFITKRLDYNSSYLNEFSIVKKWTEIESMAYKIIQNKENENNTNMPISKVFDKLFTYGVIDENDKEELKYVLNMRNKVVHHSLEQNSDLDIKKGIEKADEIISKLKLKMGKSVV